jgi:hypothetical protein
MQPFRSNVSASILSVILLLSGCTSTVVRDHVSILPGWMAIVPEATDEGMGGQGVLPIPIVYMDGYKTSGMGR